MFKIAIILGTAIVGICWFAQDDATPTRPGIALNDQTPGTKSNSTQATETPPTAGPTTGAFPPPVPGDEVPTALPPQSPNSPIVAAAGVKKASTPKVPGSGGRQMQGIPGKWVTFTVGGKKVTAYVTKASEGMIEAGAKLKKE